VLYATLPQSCRRYACTLLLLSSSADGVLSPFLCWMHPRPLCVVHPTGSVCEWAVYSTLSPLRSAHPYHTAPGPRVQARRRRWWRSVQRSFLPASQPGVCILGQDISLQQQQQQHQHQAQHHRTHQTDSHPLVLLAISYLVFSRRR